MTKSNEKPKNVLYISIDELNPIHQYTYYGVVTFGITASYLILSHFILPLLYVGAVTPLAFYGSIISVAILWVGLIKLFNNYWLQNKLISKGSLC